MAIAKSLLDSILTSLYTQTSKSKQSCLIWQYFLIKGASMSEERFVSRGFVGKRRGGEKKDRIPLGQYLTNDFPVLSAGPTPYTPLDRWTFNIEDSSKKRSHGPGMN